ncbi:hypothetical protein [Aeromonas jandaei]|uniref:hypothetical protein n=1 Tax=Aeromonas jandaei TaxID=650 RepID=UPI003D203149
MAVSGKRGWLNGHHSQRWAQKKRNVVNLCRASRILAVKVASEWSLFFGGKLRNELIRKKKGHR